MFYADIVGLPEGLRAISEDTRGVVEARTRGLDSGVPAPRLLRLAGSGGTFNP